MMSQPELTVLDVGVVVVTYNCSHVLGGLLDSLADGLKGLNWRVVFVDNASSDGSVDAIREAGFDVIVRGSNGGYSAAINDGIAHFPRAASILVLNADVELAPGAVAAMFEVLSDDRVGVVAPKMLLTSAESTLEFSQRRDPSLLSTWATALLGGRITGRLTRLSEKVSDERLYEAPRDIDWATGAVLLIGRRCIDAVGGWDESFFLYSEETDYCRRARDAGFAVRFTPGATVRHVGGGGVFQPRLRAMMVVNKVREYGRRHGSLASWCFFAGNLVNELTRAAAGRHESRFAALALISPRRRPPELSAPSLMPR